MKLKPNVQMLLLGVTAFAVFTLYSSLDFNIGDKDAEVKKVDLTSLYTAPAIDTIEEKTDQTVMIDSMVVLPQELNEDSVVDNEVLVTDPTDSGTKENYANYIPSREKNYHRDSLQNILFIGDSMLEGLSRRFADYAEENNHQLNTIIWYSSTSEIWANTDTLQYFLKKYDPSYVVICLGSNELFVKDAAKRKESVKKIVGKLGNLPYIWISPPNWKKDTGINESIISVVGKERYFDSRSLTLERKADHAHPTYPAAATWMDTIARWIDSPQCANPIIMDWPRKNANKRNVTLLKPY